MRKRLTGLGIILYTNLGKLFLIRGHLNRDLHEMREQNNYESPGEEYLKKSNKSKCKDPGAGTFGTFKDEQGDHRGVGKMYQRGQLKRQVQKEQTADDIEHVSQAKNLNFAWSEIKKKRYCRALTSNVLFVASISKNLSDCYSKVTL